MYYITFECKKKTRAKNNLSEIVIKMRQNGPKRRNQTEKINEFREKQRQEHFEMSQHFIHLSLDLSEKWNILMGKWNDFSLRNCCFHFTNALCKLNSLCGFRKEQLEHSTHSFTHQKYPSDNTRNAISLKQLQSAQFARLIRSKIDEKLLIVSVAALSTTLKRCKQTTEASDRKPPRLAASLRKRKKKYTKK